MKLKSSHFCLNDVTRDTVQSLQTSPKNSAAAGAIVPLSRSRTPKLSALANPACAVHDCSFCRVQYFAQVLAANSWCWTWAAFHPSIVALNAGAKSNHGQKSHNVSKQRLNPVRLASPSGAAENGIPCYEPTFEQPSLDPYPYYGSPTYSRCVSQPRACPLPQPAAP
jgi:hypothetical protein